MTPRWAAGTLYPTGSLVQPLTGGGATSTAITNPGFESGATDWTLGVGMSVGSTGVFAGTKSLACTGVAGVTVALHDESPVNPGQSITASCMYQQGAASAGRNVGQVFLRWFTSGMVQIGSDSDGSQITSSSGGYKQSSVTAIAPLGAAFVSIGGKVNRNQSNPSYFDNFAWNYAQAVAPAGLIYKAVQPTIGTSDATEPVWPLTVGLQVVDNTVIWEALIATRITYEASPILLSGNFEPTWPESIGGFVSDNTISWEAVPRQVIQAPQSKVVTIASSKVYAADGDIVRYCATVNPLDWTSEDDAGYLPTGLNQYGSNRTVVLNTYRGNVVSFSASTFQNWQVDPDPANITLLDSMEGIGSTHQQAAHPVANDLFYLAANGVRTVGISAGTSNLAAGDAGMPIDPLVQASMTATVRPLSTYLPSMGQYWLMMRPPLPEVLGPTITGDAPDTQIGSSYTPFQYTITPGDAPIATTSISDGSLPPGFAISDAGLLTCADPVAHSGTYTFTVTTEDENGLTDSVEDSIVIAGIVMAYGSPSPDIYSVMQVPGGTDWSGPGVTVANQSNMMQIGDNRVLLWGATSSFYTDDFGVTFSSPVTGLGGIGGDRGGCYVQDTVLVAGGGSENLYRSVDNGGSWSAVPQSKSTMNATAQGDRAIFNELIVIAPGSRFIYSDDAGLTTTYGTASGISTGNGGPIETVNGQVIIGGIRHSNARPAICYTDDCTAVTIVEITDSLTNVDVSAIGGATIDGQEIWLVGLTDGTIWWTEDRSNFTMWTEQLLGDVRSIKWDGSRFLIGGDITGYALTSEDGKAGTQHACFLDIGVIDIVVL